MQNSWKELSEPIWATTESLLFQISLKREEDHRQAGGRKTAPPPGHSRPGPGGSPAVRGGGGERAGRPRMRPGEGRKWGSAYFLQKVQLFLLRGRLEKVVRQELEQKSWGSPLRW